MLEDRRLLAGLEDFASAIDAVAVLDAATWNGGSEAVERANSYTAAFGDDLVAVDVTESYTLSGVGRSGDENGGQYNVDNLQYFGFASYDNDGEMISPELAYHIAGSETTLAQALNPGDTTVYLTSADGWSTSSSAYARVFAWYGYTDGTGYTHPDYTYTRNVVSNTSGGESGAGAWPANGVNTTADTITLSTPWSGPSLTVGAAVSNHFFASTFNYAGLESASVPNQPTQYAPSISGVSTTGAYHGQFRAGTAFIKPLVLANYHGQNDNLITWEDVELTYADPTTFHAGDSIDLHVNNFQQSFGGTDLTYQWVQIEGPTMAIVDATLSTASVTLVPWIDDYTAKFEVRMSDGEQTIKRTVEFTVDVGAVFAIDDIDVIEGDSGTTNATFTVRLTEPITSGPTTVYYVTNLANGLATAGADFTPQNVANIPVTFAAGETEKTINIPVLGDTTGEFDETFYVTLVLPVGALIGKAQGMATIIDNDTSALDLDFNLTAPSGVGSGIKDAGFTQALSYFPAYLPTYYGDATLNTAQLIGLSFEFPTGTAVPSNLELRTKLGTEVSTPQSFDATAFNAGDSVSLTALATVDDFETGLYPLDVLITANYPNGTLGTKKLSDTVIVNNLQASEFGNRRTLSFLDRLYAYDPGNGDPAGVALVRGNNGILVRGQR